MGSVIPPKEDGTPKNLIYVIFKNAVNQLVIIEASNQFNNLYTSVSISESSLANGGASPL